jgi:hypothetical protein
MDAQGRPAHDLCGGDGFQSLCASACIAAAFMTIGAVRAGYQQDLQGCGESARRALAVVARSSMSKTNELMTFGRCSNLRALQQSFFAYAKSGRCTNAEM